MAKSITVLFEGESRIVTHSDRGVNPFDPLVKEAKKLTGKKGKANSKTEADLHMISRIEFELGLYWDAKFGPYIPTANISKCLFQAATQSKRGKDVAKGLVPLADRAPLIYDGPRSVDGLFALERHVYRVSVGNRGNRIMRTRPQFPEWKLLAPYAFDEEVFDLDDIRNIADVAGAYVGLGERRPMFGRFKATVKMGLAEAQVEMDHDLVPA